jgi:hypothetical protein
MKETAKDAPRDLHSIQYAAWICENTLSMPATKSNMEVISQAIEAVAKSKFRDEKRWKKPIYTAFLWLNRQSEKAKEARIPTNHLFFLNGDYNEVPDPEPKPLPEFKPCGKCSFGWIYTFKEGKSVGTVRACECRKAWVASAK